MKNETKDLAYYLSLPYTIEVIRDNDETNSGWVARVVELPGCITQGETFNELGEMIDDAMQGWIQIALEDGILIPEPHPHEGYSGKFVIRLPKSTHRELAELAERENVSLNSFVSIALGKAIGLSSIKLETSTERIEPSPLIAWTKLSEKARQILMVNGLSNEVQEVNEKMFAGWIEEHIIQIQSALVQNDYQSAQRYIKNIRHSMEVICHQSPIINTYCHVISLLEDQINLNTKIREGLIEQSILKSRISAQTRVTTQSYGLYLNESKSNQTIRETTDEFSETEDSQGQKWVERHMETQ